MKTIYSFVPVKKKMRILEFINYHLQQHPKCQLSYVKLVKGTSKKSNSHHLELRFRGVEGLSLLIPLRNYNKVIYIYQKLTLGDILFEKYTITEALDRIESIS